MAYGMTGDATQQGQQLRQQQVGGGLGPAQQAGGDNSQAPVGGSPMPMPPMPAPGPAQQAGGGTVDNGQGQQVQPGPVPRPVPPTPIPGTIGGNLSGFGTQQLGEGGGGVGFSGGPIGSGLGVARLGEGGGGVGFSGGPIGSGLGVSEAPGSPAPFSPNIQPMGVQQRQGRWRGQNGWNQQGGVNRQGQPPQGMADRLRRA